MHSNHSLGLLRAIACVLLLSACSQTPPPQEQVEMKRLQARAQNVEIIRDDYGVPHVYAATDADAVFGLLYAQAEDDFKRVERNYIWAIGRLAEVEGEDALHSDLRARLYMTTEQAKAAYDSSPQWLKQLCDGFADGLNYYLATHPEVKPALLTRFEPWMPMFFSEGSIGGDIEQIPIAGIREFYGEVNATAPSAERDFPEPAGSNGFAISGELTESGNAMLLINPHTSFYFRGEVHVVSEEGLNAYGAVTWGQFFVYQGFNEHNGWMHTSTYVDFIDHYVEDVFERDDRLYYRYGSEIREVEVSSVTLKYLDGDKLSQRTFPMYHTHHGPVTHKLNGKWVVTRINWDPVNALQQSFIRSKTKNHREFRQMMEIRTNSSNNTVYADADGNIAYYHGNFVPRRNPGFDFSEPVDGSDPATDWLGIHAVDETISLLNPANGWIQNANSTPFTAAAQFSPSKEDYPSYMAPDVENFRGIHAVQVLTGRSGLSLDQLISLAHDPYLPAFAVLIPGLVEAYDRSAPQQAELSAAIEELRRWDYKTSADSVAMSLAHFYGMRYLDEGEALPELSQMQRVQYYGSQSPDAERLQVFAATLQQLTEDFGQWRTPWGEINRLQRLDGEIESRFDDGLPSIAIPMASGRWGALAAFGARQADNTKRIYGYRGNSFIAAVEFGEKVKARSLLAGGQSSDAGSPHFFDQAQRYADMQFKDVAYYREDVEKRAQRRYHPGD
jgi:acyl-homoserine lactone acylase PvdQ